MDGGTRCQAPGRLNSRPTVEYSLVRYDQHRATSPADQIARCRDFADERGWDIIPELIVEDAAISGSSRHNRAGLLELMDRVDEWDVLLCFDFSRLTRDSEDLGWVRNHLRVRRRTAYEASTGLEVFNVGAKVMGILNEEYLVKLRADTRRGLRGRVERGLFAGGTPYGYYTQPVDDKPDKPVRSAGSGYRLLIKNDQAEVICEIFSRFVNGEGLRTISHALNSARVPPPRARSQKAKRPGWSVSAIRSMLLNPIYRGEYTWGKSEWIRDHETGKRKRFERPESEWIRKYDSEWRIVDDAVWNAARSEFSRRGARFKRDKRGKLDGPNVGAKGKSKYLLSGLLECGECGGSFFVVTRGSHYGCGWHRDRAPAVCANSQRIARAEVEDRIITAQ